MNEQTIKLKTDIDHPKRWSQRPSHTTKESIPSHLYLVFQK